MSNMEEQESRGRVHESAAAGYASAAGIYEAGRPDYPAAVLDWLRGVVGVGAGCTVVEVGAGGGAFTARLADTDARVCAIEPVEAMRTRLARRVPRARVAAGTAEALPLGTASVDAVVCAQSFHWFASRETLREFHRVLAPDGVLALVWNVRDESVPWVGRLSAITDAYEGDTPRHKTGRWREAFEGSGFVEVDHREVNHAHTGSTDQVVIARTLSVSFVAALPREQREALERRLRAFVDEEAALAARGRVTFPYRTVMHAYRPLVTSVFQPDCSDAQPEPPPVTTTRGARPERRRPVRRGGRRGAAPSPTRPTGGSSTG